MSSSSNSSFDNLDSFQSTTIKNPDYANFALRGLNEMRLTGTLCDITILVEDKSFPAHKLILMSSCCYFDAMFNSSMSESCQKEIRLKEVDPEIFSHILHYLYTGEIHINGKNALKMLSASYYFQVDWIRIASSAIIAKSMNFKNCIEILQYAEYHSCKDLKDISKTFILENFIDIAFEEEFDYLNYKQISELVSDQTFTYPEEHIYLAIVKWVKYDIGQRHQYLIELLKNVCFPLISTWFYQSYLIRERLIGENPTIMEMIEKALSISNSSEKFIIVNRKAIKIDEIEQGN